MLTQWATRVEGVLDQLLPEAEGPVSALHEAMRYASLGGGKRLRASLVYSTGALLEVDTSLLDRPAAAVEMVHAYSLVHDDLPAMDNDDLRRGKPTCHRAFGEAIAILAGDALQTRAFEILCEHDSALPANNVLRMIKALAQSSGVAGMAGGQAIDLDAVGKNPDLEYLEIMHSMKTGALIRASVRLGALCSSTVTRDTLNQLDIFARCIGLAFQVIDDILDEVSDSGTLGKTGGSDRARNKPTYTSTVGLANARRIVDTLHGDALASLKTIRHNTDNMRQLADFIICRSH